MSDATRILLIEDDPFVLGCLHIRWAVEHLGLSSTGTVDGAILGLIALTMLSVALLALARRPARLLRRSPEDGSRTALAFILILLLLAAGIVATGHRYYRNEQKHFRAEVEQQLSAIAKLKVGELVQWRKHHMENGAIFFKNPSFTALVRRFFEQPADTDAPRQLLDWLGRYPGMDDYDQVRLIDVQSVTRLLAPAGLNPASSNTVRAASEVLRSGQIAIQDFYRDEHNQRVYLAVLVPILDERDASRPLGVLVLRIDPETKLYPFIKLWPTPSPTAETLLVRREGNETVFLNEPRFQTNTALNFRASLDRVTLPAAQAVLGRKDIMEGMDYRGVPVVAALRTIPDSPWALVARMDVAEVYGSMRKRLWQVVGMIGALLLGAGAWVGLIWRQERVRFYRGQYESAKALRESESLLRESQSIAGLGSYVFDVPTGSWKSSEVLDKLFGIGDAYERSMAGWAALLHLDDRAVMVDYLQHEVIGRGQTFDKEYRIIRHDDQAERWVHGLGKLKFDAQGRPLKMLGTIRDITERRQTQQLLAWEKSALELISSAASLHEVLDGLMLGLEKQSPGALCSVLMLDDDGIHLRHGAAPSLPQAYNRLIDGVAIGPTVGSCGTAAYADRQVIVSDIGSDPLWADYRDLALGHGLRACWSTPIHGDEGKILGTFAIYYHEPRDPVPAELELVARASHITRIALDRKHAEEKIRALNTGLERRVEERTRELDAANKSLTDFKAALNEHVLVAITDSCGKITYANDKFCAISKYSQEELIGQDHRIINSGHHPKAFMRDLWQTITRGRVWKGEIKNRAKDGSFYWVNTTIALFLGQGGMPAQFIAIRTDITKRKQAEEEINKLNGDLQSRAAELEAANKELEAFSYSVSHDLRAPLRAVDCFSRMVIEDYDARLDDEGRRMLCVILSETQRMGRLIDDLLAFSRLGRQQMELAPIDMHALAQEVFNELAALEPERKLRLDLHPLPPAAGAEAMIRQVWVNLVSNAIKFTKERELGEIEIGARDGEDGGHIYCVKDNGAGFDMRHAAKLFNVFQRLHSQQEFPGTGVGLALVQRIVERHGGRVWAEAEANRGAIFCFTLPNSK